MRRNFHVIQKYLGGTPMWGPYEVRMNVSKPQNIIGYYASFFDRESADLICKKLNSGEIKIP